MIDHAESPETAAKPWMVRSDHRRSCLVVSGEIDADAVHALDEAWASIQHGASTVIDLSAVTFFSAAGVGRLVGWVRDAGGTATVLRSAAVERLLTICTIGTTSSNGDGGCDRLTIGARPLVPALDGPARTPPVSPRSRPSGRAAT